MGHGAYVHSPPGGHLGGFQVLATMNEAAVHTHGKVFVWTSALSSSGRVPRSTIAGSDGEHIFSFGGNQESVFQSLDSGGTGLRAAMNERARCSRPSQHWVLSVSSCWTHLLEVPTPLLRGNPHTSRRSPSRQGALRNLVTQDIIAY